MLHTNACRENNRDLARGKQEPAHSEQGDAQSANGYQNAIDVEERS